MTTVTYSGIREKLEDSDDQAPAARAGPGGVWLCGLRPWIGSLVGASAHPSSPPVLVRHACSAAQPGLAQPKWKSRQRARTAGCSGGQTQQSRASKGVARVPPPSI